MHVKWSMIGYLQFVRIFFGYFVFVYVRLLVFEKRIKPDHIRRTFSKTTTGVTEECLFWILVTFHRAGIVFLVIVHLSSNSFCPYE